jgi:hypothetical protein
MAECDGVALSNEIVLACPLTRCRLSFFNFGQIVVPFQLPVIVFNFGLMSLSIHNCCKTAQKVSSFEYFLVVTDPSVFDKVTNDVIQAQLPTIGTL